MPEPRPHRRLSLTQPTQGGKGTAPEPSAVEPPVAPPAKEPVKEAAPKGEAAAPVRMMAYLTQEEADALDDLIKAFPRPRPSKSDVLRAALEMGRSDPEGLKDAYRRLSDTTTSRRDSKPA